MNPKLIAAIVAAAVASLGLFGCASSLPRDFNSIGDVMHYVDTSSDPRAVALRAEIANGPADLAKDKASALRGGIALTMTVSTPPAAKNAETLYRRWRRLQRQDKYSIPEYAETLGYEYDYTPAQLERVRQTLREQSASFDLLHKAVNQAVWVSYPGSNPDFASLREAAREIEMESYILASDGHFKEAVANQALGFKIAKQLQYQPTIVSCDVSAAVDGITLYGFRNILYLAGTNAAVDEQVLSAMQKSNPDLRLRASLVGEIGFDLTESDRVRTGTPADVEEDVQELLKLEGSSRTWSQRRVSPAERRFVGDLIDASEAQDLESLRKCISAVGKAPSVRRAVFAAVGNEVNDIGNVQAGIWLGLLGGGSLVGVPAGLRGAKLDGLDQRVEASQAEAQVVAAVAYVLREKARTQRFPTALPAGFIDPFDDKPLGYRREGSAGFVIYSVGEDGTNAGGKAGEWVGWQQHAFRYPAPPRIPAPKSDMR